MKTLLNIQKLAPILVGKGIKHVSSTPLTWKGDVGTRDCLVHFGDGTAVLLNSADLESELEYYADGVDDNGLVIDTELSQTVSGQMVQAVISSQNVFSFGLLLTDGPVICGDFLTGQDGVYQAACVMLMSEFEDDRPQLFGK
ncbi:hypothetical protein [Brevifollis gellanilyticus]|uniref:hypothetical protein n=1 Tax=Brevifollis gellanilyticus TaxID=748831 RepID=UPI0011BD978B|nr:hypothetical protein [Brevifollis gellanilyticus]